MSNLTNPKTLARLWAALKCDFELVIQGFMGRTGWSYADFAEVCRETQITLVMHTTQSRSKDRDEHYTLITNMILQICKDLWLQPLKNEHHVSPAPLAKTLASKRSLAGFYMLYTMYEKQPIADRTKISLGLEDMANIASFHRELKGMDIYPEVAFMIQYLHVKQSFYFCIFAEELRFDSSTRNYLNLSRSKVVTMTEKMQETHDALVFSPINRECQDSFMALSLSKNEMRNNLIKSINPETIQKHMSDMSMFRTFIKTVNNEHFQTAMDKLDKLLLKPILTLQTLIASDGKERQIIEETKKRVERARKKKARVSIDKELRNLLGRCVPEGGCSGTKKDLGHWNARVEQKDCAPSSNGLWIYISGQDYKKPYDLWYHDPGSEDGNQSKEKAAHESQGQEEEVETGMVFKHENNPDEF